MAAFTASISGPSLTGIGRQSPHADRTGMRSRVLSGSPPEATAYIGNSIIKYDTSLPQVTSGRFVSIQLMQLIAVFGRELPDTASMFTDGLRPHC
jgi:hypothetical protein